MNLNGMLDSVLSFVLVMFILSLLVQALMELIKRFFATKAKTMEAMLEAMGEHAICEALVAMKTAPSPPKQENQASQNQQQNPPAQNGVVQQNGATAQSKKDSKTPLPGLRRGSSNITPEALKAELVRNAIAVSQSICENFSQRAELWDTALQAASQLAASGKAYATRVGENCVLTPADLAVLDKLSQADLKISLNYVGDKAPNPASPAEFLTGFEKAAGNQALLDTLSLKTTDPAAFGDLPGALRHLGALTPTQARALFGEYVVPLRDEVEQLLSTAGTAAEKFGKLLPGNIRERLYDVGRDAAQAQKAVEDWYDSWMAQFSALYEAKLKVWAFWIGLFVVVALNANALNIFDSISRSSALRATLLQNAGQNKIVKELTPLTQTGSTLKAEDLKKYQNAIDDIYQLKIVGWQDANWPNDRYPFLTWLSRHSSWIGNHSGQVLEMLFGWLLTAFLIGVGAPFWHDLFDALLSVRMGKEPKPAGGGATA